jgi:hypothetical protein
VLDLVRARATEIDDRIAELRRLWAELDALTLRAQTFDVADCDPSRVCHLIGPA